MENHALEMTTTTVPITRDNLPVGPVWDEDGACFKAEPCEPHPLTRKDWRWAPLNLLAFRKGEPDKPMHDHPPMSPEMVARLREYATKS